MFLAGVYLEEISALKSLLVCGHFSSGSSVRLF